jgi:NAD(P)-dependent dehydrogenase (short-subunit alcohol dehydrogenase family)
MIQALDAAPADADTLIVDHFPDLLEHIELITRIGDVKLKRIIFRKASRTHGYFLSSNAHARLDTFDAIGVRVYWYDESTKELYAHVYKKGHGFFVREELTRKFQETTILAFYGSAVGLDPADTARITGLVEGLTGFIGPNVGVLTGGGGGVMRLATDQARSKGALTGLMRTLSHELGGSHITVNAVAPGFIATSILNAIPENVMNQIKGRVALGRLGKPEEIASVYAFLASEDASYINGAVIEVSGGLTV